MNKQTFINILSLLDKKQRRHAFLLFLLLLVGVFIETLGVSFVVPVMALMTQPNLAQTYPKLAPYLAMIGNPSQVELIIYSVSSLVVVYLFKMLILTIIAWFESAFTYKLQGDLSQKLYSHYLHQPYTFHLQRNSAELISSVTSEVGVFAFNAVAPIIRLMSEILVIGGLLTLLLFVEPMGALLAMVTLGGAAIAFHRITKNFVNKWAVSRQLHDVKRSQHLYQGLSGVKDAKILGREKYFVEQYNFHNRQTIKAGQLELVILQLPRLWIEFLAVVGIATLIMVMLYQDKSFSEIIPILGVFVATAFRLMPSLNRILGSLQSLRFGMPMIERLQAEMRRIQKAPPVEETAEGESFTTAIKVKDVTFTYHGAATSALKGLSLSINKGQSVGFIGQSGSGKSTLVDVILGLLPPQSGMIEVDGKDVFKNLTHWQRQIGYVSQAIYLTDDTLRKNIAFGLPDSEIDDEAVWRALRYAQLDEFVSGLPDGINSYVGERGVRLSGGQRQRIGIARALYHDPQILVLDEATSALDTPTEAEVMKAINKLHGEKTVVIVAHRLTTVANCDRIYQLSHGLLTAEGTPSEVLQ